MTNPLASVESDHVTETTKEAIYAEVYRMELIKHGDEERAQRRAARAVEHAERTWGDW